MTKPVASDRSNENFDVAIIGGGVMGTAIARDAALRGLKVILLEMNDFGSGTSSRSSRLIHGGLRYLAHFDFGLVKQDLTERELLLRNAPHLVKPLPFLIPIYDGGLLARIKLGTGLKLYDWFARGSRLPKHRWLSKEKVLSIEPSLNPDELRGAYQYYDAQAPFAERICIENALDAQTNGAVILNHTEVIGISKDNNGRVCGLTFQDCSTGQRQRVNIQVVINASGPELDEVNSLNDPLGTKRIKRTRGAHLVTQPISSNAIVLFTKRDGRLFFVLPWLGHTMLGTTDVQDETPVDKLTPDSTDIEYLTTETERFIPSSKSSEMLASYVGVRSLENDEGKSASETSRDATIFDHEGEGTTGLISLIGGKLTAHRGLAQEVTDLMCKKLGSTARSTTHMKPLPGAPSISIESLTKQAVVETLELGLPEGTVKYLVSVYGERYKEVLMLVEGEGKGGHKLSESSPAILAQVWYSIEKEWAKTLSDFMLRRSMIGLMPPTFGLDALETVASEMAKCFGHSESWASEQVYSYREFVRGNSWLKVY